MLFYARYLENKDKIYRFNIKLRFRIIDVVNRHNILKKKIIVLTVTVISNEYRFLNLYLSSISNLITDSNFNQLNYSNVITVELIGFSFDKPANTKYFALRFLQILKIHENRSFENTVSFIMLYEITIRYKEISEGSKKEETC